MPRSFPGAASNYLDCGDQSGIDITGTNLTISAWVRPVTTGATRTVVGKAGSAATDRQYLFQVLNDGGLDFHVGDAAGRDEVFSSGSVVNERWTHVAARKDPTTITIWANARRQAVAGGSESSTLTIQNLAKSMFIGQQETNATGFSGLMADLALWDVSLTAYELALLAIGVSPLDIRPTSLRGFFPLDDYGGSGVARDHSRHNTVPTMVGAISLAPDDRPIQSVPASVTSHTPRFKRPGLATRAGVIRTPKHYPQAVRFTDETEYYQIADASSLNLGVDITFCAWIRPDALDPPVGNTQCLYTDLKESTTEYTADFRLVSSGGQLVASSTGTLADGTSANSTVPLTIGKWTHLCIAHNSVNAFFLYNGLLVSTVAMNRGATQYTSNWRIGRCNGTTGGIGTRPFVGAMRDLAVWNRRLEISEIKNHMHGTPPVDAILVLDHTELQPRDIGPNKHPITIGQHPKRMTSAPDTMPDIAATYGMTEVLATGVVFELEGAMV